MAKPAVFLDTSIFITALLSSKGGSFYILNNFKDRVEFLTNEYVLEELKNVLHKKFSDAPGMHAKLFLILGVAGVTIKPNPKKRAVINSKKLISEKDAPILASALGESDFLLTLDNEFFNQSILDLAARKKLAILKPKNFIELIGR